MIGAVPLFRFRDPFGVPLVVNRSAAYFAATFLIGAGVFAKDAWFSTILMIFIVFSVYAHEMGHVLAARAVGVRVNRVTFHGGCSGHVDHEVAPPGKTILILVAGPLVNLTLYLSSVVLAAALKPVGPFYYGAEGLATSLLLNLAVVKYINFFGILNLFLLILNLLPVIPLDGGRLMFLCLWWKLPRDVSMRITGLFGLVISVLWWPMLLLLFVSGKIILFWAPSIQDNLQRLTGKKQD